MNTISVKYVLFIIAFLCFPISLSKGGWAMESTILVRLNSPLQSNFIEGFSAESINGPTVNMGIQHFSKQVDSS